MPAKKTTTKKVTKTTKTEAPVEKEVKQAAKSGTEKVDQASTKAATKKTTSVKASKESADTKTTKVRKTATTKKATVKKEEKVEEAPKKATTTKKTTAAKKTTAKKATVKAEEKVEEAPKKATTTKKATTAKKTTAKKTTAAKKTTTAKKATVKVEEKVEEAPKKATTTKKASTAKKTTAAKKTTTTKKTTAKKAATKKAAPKKSKTALQKEKLAQYNSFTLDTCIDMAKAMGVDMGYDQYASALLDYADLQELSKAISDKYDLASKNFTFEDDGYDAELIDVLLARVADTVDVKASDFLTIKDDVKAHEKYKIKDDSTANNDEYNAEFNVVKRVLMIAQRKDAHSTTEIKKIIKVDPTKMIEKYMDLAYNVLKLWKYDDVKYYENFIYAVLSQFEDLHEKLGTRAMMDVADLYINHGDYGLGDANYNYILRENEIKDYIYYRFANIYYQDIDRDKARSIANSALQYVDDRFTYYPNIVEILEN